MSSFFFISRKPVGVRPFHQLYLKVHEVQGHETASFAPNTQTSEVRWKLAPSKLLRKQLHAISQTYQISMWSPLSLPAQEKKLYVFLPSKWKKIFLNFSQYLPAFSPRSMSLLLYYTFPFHQFFSFFLGNNNNKNKNQTKC